MEGRSACAGRLIFFGGLLVRVCAGGVRVRGDDGGRGGAGSAGGRGVEKVPPVIGGINNFIDSYCRL